MSRCSRRANRRVLDMVAFALLPMLGGALLVTSVLELPVQGAGMQAATAKARAVPLDRPANLVPHATTVAVTDYRGRRALKVNRAADVRDSDTKVLLKDERFGDGTIELDVAGNLAAGADPNVARGFIGVAFRVAPDLSRYELIYLRPTNGRADDQIRRNHSVQYSSHPDYPWFRLRKEFPEKYESYVDLEVGAWTPMKVVVKGTTARLFVHGASQPCLIVNDLKLGAGEGGVALSIDASTEGYFSNLRITPAGETPKSPAP